MKRRICRVPGCEAKLARGNISTVCVNHMHAPGLCQCRQCTKQDVKPKNAGLRDNPNVLYELPTYDAPLSEWLKPLSAQMINRRMHTGGSTVAPSLHGSRLSKSGSLRERVNA